MPDTLVFSHANGFPLPVYRRLLDAVRPELASVGVVRLGHDPLRPPTPGWPHLVDELVEYVHALPQRDGRLWLAGHSLGGYLSVLAAERLGARVAGVVMLDSPVMGPAVSAAVRLARAAGLDRLLMPIRQTRQRCNRWPDIDAAHAHYAAKPAFARWHPEMLRDYAEHGTLGDGRGARRLLFEPEIEYRIYRGLPTGRVAAAGRRLRAPVAFIAGRQSREVRQIGLRATRALVGERLYWVPGSHLFPMEAPDATAAALRDAIAALRAAGDVSQTDPGDAASPGAAHRSDAATAHASPPPPARRRA